MPWILHTVKYSKTDRTSSVQQTDHLSPIDLPFNEYIFDLRKGETSQHRTITIMQCNLLDLATLHV